MNKKSRVVAKAVAALNRLEFNLSKDGVVHDKKYSCRMSDAEIIQELIANLEAVNNMYSTLRVQNEVLQMEIVRLLDNSNKIWSKGG